MSSSHQSSCPTLTKNLALLSQPFHLPPRRHGNVRNHRPGCNLFRGRSKCLLAAIWTIL
jgi:hypothetical protein